MSVEPEASVSGLRAAQNPTGAAEAAHAAHAPHAALLPLCPPCPQEPVRVTSYYPASAQADSSGQQPAHPKWSGFRLGTTHGAAQQADSLLTELTGEVVPSRPVHTHPLHYTSCADPPCHLLIAGMCSTAFCCSWDAGSSPGALCTLSWVLTEDHMDRKSELVWGLLCCAVLCCAVLCCAVLRCARRGAARCCGQGRSHRSLL